MKILVIGSGGREHAIAWRLLQSPKVQCIYVAPGNGGTAQTPGLINLPIEDLQSLCDFVKEEKIAFTVVGPEAPLAKGVVDLFRQHQLKIFGPTQAAAQLESSKSFAKAFMQRHNIPTAAYACFQQAAPAHAYVDLQGAPIVIKADGLAAGKGVVVAETLAQAHAAIQNILGTEESPCPGQVVIEEFMQGEEASFIVISDGKNVVPLVTTQDHKRLLDKDQGPNTGGMGAYSPAPIVTVAMHARIMREIIMPTIKGMAAEGMPFTGFLYAGIMVTPEGPKVVEFNCRLGDPETQPILMRLKSDLVHIFETTIAEKVDSLQIDWDIRAALGVVIAAQNYPDTPRKGDIIQSLPENSENIMVFHAGTQYDSNTQTLKTNGGRVLCVTALGDSIRFAQTKAYEAVRQVQFDGMQFRQDIGWRAISK